MEGTGDPSLAIEAYLLWDVVECAGEPAAGEVPGLLLLLISRGVLDIMVLTSSTVAITNATQSYVEKMLQRRALPCKTDTRILRINLPQTLELRCDAICKRKSPGYATLGAAAA